MAVKPYLRLTRPANLVTAAADILAGMTIGQFLFATSGPWWLLPATIGLYGGGVVLNDVFDARLDAVERPERPIPSGQVSLARAAIMGAALLLAGIVCAGLFHPVSAVLAGAIALMTLVYNRFAKHHKLLGPVTMGLCRGGNLLLGISAVPESVALWWPLAFVPVVYIAAITLISQDEVHGGKRLTLWFAGALYLVVHSIQAAIAFRMGNGFLALPFILIHAGMIGYPLFKAIQNPVGPLIGKAVKTGVLSLIVMNAAWCMAFGYPLVGMITLLLLPVSLWLSKQFAVT